MLEARDLYFRVLKGVSVTVRPGAILALLGPNGAGKSTLLKLLCGELKANRGDVFLAGKSLHLWSPRERARTLAVLPQNSLLHSAFTVEQVVALGRMPHSRSTKDGEIVQAALAAVEAGELIGRSYLELSGGEQQRVQLARVLAQIWEARPPEDRFLLLDEPTSNLDLAQQHRLFSAARTMAARGVGVFAIMHDMNLAAQYATEIMLLHDGQTFAYGTPEDVLTAENVQATFNCPVTIIDHPTRAIPVVVPD